MILEGMDCFIASTLFPDIVSLGLLILKTIGFGHTLLQQFKHLTFGHIPNSVGFKFIGTIILRLKDG